MLVNGVGRHDRTGAQSCAMDVGCRVFGGTEAQGKHRPKRGRQAHG